MRIRNPPKFIMNTSFIMKVIMTLIVFQWSALAYVDPLDTPRPKLLAPPLPAAAPWELKPRRIGADAAQAGPNGAAEGCGLQRGSWNSLMCSVHVQRAITKGKHYFNDPGNAGKMNVDIERLKNNSITVDLAIQGKKLLVIKYKAEKEGRAAACYKLGYIRMM